MRKKFEKKSHYVRKNHSSDTPSNIIVVDTESFIKKDGEKEYQSFRLGYAIHMVKSKGRWWNNGYELKCVEDFWDLLDKCRYDGKKLYVYAHNMAYDYTILKLDSYFSSRRLEIKMRVIDSVFIVSLDGMLFLSTTNYYKQSLKELGKIFGLEKIEIDGFENISDDELMKYCIRDVEVLRLIIDKHIRFIIDNDLGCMKPTIAGQALTAFRHRFMNCDLLVHTHKDILDMEKESYRGGRCEAFRIGEFSDVYYLDINSMYPHVMKENYYPTRLVSSVIFENVKYEDMISCLNHGKFLMIDCDMILEKPIIGVKKEKLLFPIGKVRQVITNPEIEYLINNPECGRIVSVNKMVVYEKEKVFVDYVDFFYYGIRMNATNNADKTMAKIMLNSLYGKFGQSNSTELSIVTDENVIEACNVIMNASCSFEFMCNVGEKYIRLGNFIYHIKQSDGEYGRDSIPIIASAVTSYARIQLWEIIKKAGYENVYYCDTDSVFVNKVGYDNLIDEINPGKLGMLKMEDNGICKIYGVKDYVFNDDVKLKGVKRNAEKLSDGRFRQKQFQTKNKRYSNGTPDGIVIVENVYKVISRKYDKGIVKNGIVYPFEFSDF